MVMSSDEILDVCKKLGKELSNRLADEEKLPIFVCTMKGAMQFCVDLMKYVTVPSIVDYVQLSSYNGMQSTGKVNLIKDMSYSVDNRTIIIVEDVVDTGYSMKFLKEHIQSLGKPKDVLICALFDKEPLHKVEVKVDYVGKRLTESKFLIGYGLDYREIQRNVPYVYVPKEEEVKEMDRLIDEKLI